LVNFEKSKNDTAKRAVEKEFQKEAP